MVSRGGRAVRFGWLSALIAPPSVAAILWPRVVAGHLSFAAILAAAYEGVVITAGFAGGVFGDLTALWRERLVERADLALRRRVSRFGQRYREFVLAEMRFIELKGLATVGHFTPELDEVFVDVSLAFRAPHQVPASLLAGLPADITERHALQEFLDRPDPVMLAVIGGPGSGKTTLLRHTARQVCLARRGRLRSVPMLLYLRDHVAAIVAEPGVGMAHLLRGTLGDLRNIEPTGWFEQHLRRGDCVMLLDGLDEVARQEDRTNVAAWVERQVRQYPGNDYVITSRPHGYRTARIDGAAVLQVRSFAPGQVTRFVHGWYLAVERHSTGTEGQDIARRVTSGADDLLERLDSAPALHDLTVNPLLLTMIANVHRYRGALPGSRAELYSEICQVMLWRRQEAKKLTLEMSGDKKETLLRGLAYAMMQQRLRDLPRDDVLAEFGPALRRVSRQVTAERFLADVSSNGLLVERESGLYSFAHHTFQEYLAAACVRDKGLVSVLANAVDDIWWRETTLLYAARADAGPVVQACLDSASVTALSLAFDCANQDSELAPDLRDRLDRLLETVFVSGTDPERRRMITRVLLTRHLHQQISTRDNSQICARPITADFYWLFLRSAQHSVPHGPPLTKMGDKPATVMYGDDVVALVHWVNDLTGGGTAYRLLSPAEIDETAVQRHLTTSTADGSDRSLWLMSDHGHPELWVPPGAPHPQAIDAETLTAHIETDVTTSIPTLTRLLLLRSVVVIRVIARGRYLDRALHCAHELARDLERDPALDLERALALDRVLARDPGRGLSHDLGGDCESALDRDLHRHLARALDLALPLARELPRTLDLAVDLARDLDRSILHYLNPGSDFARVTGKALSRIAGKALSRTLSQALGDTTNTASWPVKFSRAFADITGIAATTYVVSPSTLADKLGASVQRLVPILRPRAPWEESEFSWTFEVASRLQKIAAPVFDRRENLTPAIATYIRLPALCAAAEADALHQPRLGDAFREIAAGVTLLERRANGAAPATETILLAAD